MANLQIFIISWQGQHDNARAVALTLKNVGAAVTVVYSDPNSGFVLDTSVATLRRPNHLFFGDKFQACLDAFDAERMLIIHADCQCRDWVDLVARSEASLAKYPQIWMWAPCINYTGFSVDRTRILDIRDSSLKVVAHADTIIFSITKPIIDRLRKASLEGNVYGWGIGWIAAAFAYTHQHWVVVDTQVSVTHPKGRGYASQDAAKQRDLYMKQLNASESIQCSLLKSHMALQDLSKTVQMGRKEYTRLLGKT